MFKAVSLTRWLVKIGFFTSQIVLKFLFKSKYIKLLLLKQISQNPLSTRCVFNFKLRKLWTTGLRSIKMTNFQILPKFGCPNVILHPISSWSSTQFKEGSLKPSYLIPISLNILMYQCKQEIKNMHQSYRKGKSMC